MLSKLLIFEAFSAGILIPFSLLFFFLTAGPPCPMLDYKRGNVIIEENVKKVHLQC